MNENERLRQILAQNLDVSARDGTRKNMREAVLRAYESIRRTHSATTPTVTGRFVMNKPIARFAVAAAIVAAVVLGLFEVIGTGAGSGVVWADVARKVQASRSVVFRTTERIVPDTYNRQVDFNMQYCTSTQSRLDKYKGGEVVTTIWGDCDAKIAILVDHDHKSYVKMVLEETMPDRLGTTDPNSWVQKFLSCQYRKLGCKTIDGVLCEGIETTDPAFYGSGNPSEPAVARLWVSVETGYPVQFESERVYDGARHTLVQDQFQWDADLDESLFEPNIPDGYLDISP